MRLFDDNYNFFVENYGGAEGNTPFGWLHFRERLYHASEAPNAFVWTPGGESLRHCYYGGAIPLREQKHLRKCLLGEDIFLRYAVGCLDRRDWHADEDEDSVAINVRYTASIWKYPRRGTGKNYLLEVPTPVGVYREGFNTTDLWCSAAAQKGSLIFEFVCRSLVHLHDTHDFLNQAMLERVLEGVENPVLFPEDADLLNPDSPKTQKMRKIVHAD